jgi:hypothetical protein
LLCAEHPETVVFSIPSYEQGTMLVAEITVPYFVYNVLDILTNTTTAAAAAATTITTTI